MIARPYTSSSSRTAAAAVKGQSKPTARTAPKKQSKKEAKKGFTIGGFSPIDDIAWGSVVKTSVATTIALSIAYTLFLFST